MKYGMLTEFKKHRKVYYVLFLIIYFICLIYLADKIYIWEDESYSLHTSSNNLLNVIKLSYNFEGQPAFYFVILSLWRLFNSSIFFARLLSVIFIACAAYFFERIVALISNKDENKQWLVILFLLNPFIVWAALEIRLYALVILISTVSIYYFLRFYLENKTKYLLILSVITLIGLYTQYFIAFLTASFALTMLIFKGWKSFLKFSVYFIPVVLLFLPNLIFIKSQVSMGRNYLSSYSPLDSILYILRTPQDFLLSFSIGPFDKTVRWIIKLFFLLLFIKAFLDLYKKNKKDGNPCLKILYIILFSICVIEILYIIFVPSLSLIYAQKYQIITLPLFILLLVVFENLSLKRIFFTGLSLYYIFLLAFQYKYPTKSYDFKKVSTYIKSIEFKNEPIVFYGKTILPPFEYYYKGNDKLYGLPAIHYDKHYYEERISDTTAFVNLIEKTFSPTNSYILVTGSIEGFKYDANMTKQMIEQSLQNHFKITLDSSFKSPNSSNTLRVQRLIKR